VGQEGSGQKRHQRKDASLSILKSKMLETIIILIVGAAIGIGALLAVLYFLAD
jgi:hypothetical protein